MKVITFASQKGGSGKSTLARNLAALSAGQGARIGLIDLDDQQTTAKWASSRTQKDLMLLPVTAENINAKLDALRKQDLLDFVFIDTPGKISDVEAKAISVADFVIIPTSTAADNLATIKRTAENVKEAGIAGGIIITQDRKRKSRRFLSAAQVAQSLSDLPVCGEGMTSRVAFSDGFITGEGIHEIAPNDFGVTEIKRIWTWVQNQLGVNYE